MSNEVKSCMNCTNRLGSNSSVAVFGSPIPVVGCRAIGRVVSVDTMSAEERIKSMEDFASDCTSYNREISSSDQTDRLRIGIFSSAATIDTDVSGANSKAGSCRACYFHIPVGKMIEKTTIPMGACARYGKLIPEQRASVIARGCNSSTRSAVTDPEAHYRGLLDSLVLDPTLERHLFPERNNAVASRDMIDMTVEPSTYPSDRAVTAQQDAQGIRAWRRITMGGRELFIPIFKREIFSAVEAAKIPATGDDEHPETYVDHMQLTFTVAALWFHLDETPSLVGKAGTGKGHPVDTNVLTPEGWRRVGDLQVGDHVVGSDGKPTRVRGVFDRGVLPVNRVTMNDGSSVLVDNDHLWHVTTIDKRTYVKDTRTLRKEGLFRTVKRGNGRTSPAYKFAIPQVEPVQFEGGDLPIHPYVLGVLLANGLASDPLYYTKDKYVSDKVGRLVEQKDRSVKSHPVPRFVVKGGTWKELIKLNLNGRLSAQKFIPEQYLFASEDDRRELLAGLMDCDGTVTQAGGNTQYCTTSQHLAEGVVELVQSLGGTASIQYSGRTNKDGVLVERYEKTVNISMGNNCPFQTPLKAKKVGRSAHRKPVRKIKSIESAGTAEVRCISVEAADELYVTENYIVTHNTEFYRYMAWLMQVPFERISITRDSEIDDLAGKMHFENNETVFKPGRIPKAWVKPNVLVLDEPNTGPPEVWQYIRPLTDNSKQLVNDKNEGETISRHPFAFLGLAMNPAWDHRNVGAEQIGDADGSRLMHIYVDMPPESVERSIIVERCKLDQYLIEDDMLETLMRVAKDIRELSDDGTLPITWGVRNQIKVARATAWFDLEKAYRLAVLDYLEPEARETVMEVVLAHSKKKGAVKSGLFTGTINFNPHPR